MELSSKHPSLSLFGCFLVLARAKLKICHALIPTLEEKESSKSCQPDIVPTWTQQTESTFLVSFENRVACLCVFPANVGSFGVPQADLMLTMSIAGAGVVLGYKRSHCSILVDWCRMFCHLCRLRCRRNGRTSHLLLFPCPLTRRVWRDRTNDSVGGGESSWTHRVAWRCLRPSYIISPMCLLRDSRLVEHSLSSPRSLFIPISPIRPDFRCKGPPHTKIQIVGGQQRQQQLLPDPVCGVSFSLLLLSRTNAGVGPCLAKA